MAHIQQSLFPDSNTPITPLSGVHSAKRGRNERKGMHAWHPYYAGYSEKFVRDVITVLAKPNYTLLDPWNGSGTTTLVGQYLDFYSIGIEVNPAMAIHAAAKDLALDVPDDELRAIEVKTAEYLDATQHDGPDDLADHPLINWVGDDALRGLWALKQAIDAVVNPVEMFSPTASFATVNSKASFYYSALFQSLRDVGNFTNGSNPTWLKNIAPSTLFSAKDALEIFRSKIEIMKSDHRVLQQRYPTSGTISILSGDCRSMELDNEQIDLVITSPPYCTRIDYAYATKPELLLIGEGEDDVNLLRKATMGAPVIVNKDISVSPIWGPTCLEFLSAVLHHQSKASKSYYYPNFLQYFSDAERAVREIARVLKPACHAVIVVQSSFYKEIEIPLGEIYTQLAVQLGLEAEIAKREVIRQHMAHVNTKSQGYVKNKVYHEDVVLLTKPRRELH